MEPNPYKIFVNMHTLPASDNVVLAAANADHMVFLSVTPRGKSTVDVAFEPKDFLSFAYGVQEAVFALTGQRLVPTEVNDVPQV